MWIQLLIGWVPVWALYSTMILTAHAGSSVRSAVFAGVRATIGAALLGLLVHRLTQRIPWPRPVRLPFAATHVVAAALYSVSWVALTLSLEIVLGAMHGGRLRLSSAVPIGPFLMLGGWMYAMVAGVSYAMQASQRAAAAEALAAQSQLATLRAQLNPHFLFNALHTVVQLIPLDPAQASQAAEKLAALLRSGLEEQRDLIPLRDEWTFVQRYVELEQMRFGDRLIVDLRYDPAIGDALVPSFAVQTLIENAVQHGAAPRAAATRVTATAARAGDCVTVVVFDDGDGASDTAMQRGTGLSRLRDRLRVLFGAQGTLQIESTPGAGFRATIAVPFRSDDD
jgi:signal transduction histidine kinase